MAGYLTRRLGQSLMVLCGILLIVFAIGSVIGDPVDLMLPPEASAEQRAALRAELGFGDGLAGQFGAFAERVVLHQFGDSLWQRVPALDLVLSRLPATLYLTFVALAIAVPVGVALGSLAALWPRSLLDRMISLLSYVAISAVEFWVGLMLVLVFAVHLGVFRTGGYGGLEYVVLPALAVAFRTIGRLAQVTRTAMIDELGKPYVAVARAKGMPESRVFLHALKNAAIPVVTLLGDEMNNLVGGAIVIETVFAWPGVGLLLLQAIELRDLHLVQATIFVIAVMVIVVNLLVDLVYTLLDRRIVYA